MIVSVSDIDARRKWPVFMKIIPFLLRVRASFKHWFEMGQRVWWGVKVVMIKARLGETCNLSKDQANNSLGRIALNTYTRDTAAQSWLQRRKKEHKQYIEFHRTREETTLDIMKGKAFGVIDTNGAITGTSYQDRFYHWDHDLLAVIHSSSVKQVYHL